MHKQTALSFSFLLSQVPPLNHSDPNKQYTFEKTKDSLMLIPNFPSNLSRCVCMYVHVSRLQGWRVLASPFSHLGLLTSSESTVMQLAGTAGQLHSYHLLETTFCLWCCSSNNAFLLFIPPTGTCRVLIIKVITICIQTTVAQAVDWDADVGHTQFWKGL